MSGINLLEFFVVAAILALVGIPLFSKFPPRRLFTPPDPEAEEYKHLLVRKEEILLSIKELEFDLKTEKVSSEDFETIRAKLENEALKVLDRIDVLEKALKNKKGSTADAASS
jgi:hypothetical protein